MPASLGKTETAKVKICGLKNRSHIEAAIDNGADFLGFVFFDKSPRDISIEKAVELFDFARTLSAKVKLVAVVVSPDDALLAQLSTIGHDYLQIHGDISPARAMQIKQMGFDIIVAFGISGEADFAQTEAFENIADFFLFDAKPPNNAANQGGFGVTFDWELMLGFECRTPWFLSGGLTPNNVAAAIAATGAPMVDVSSGVESAVGVKDLALIKSFINAAKGEEV